MEADNPCFLNFLIFTKIHLSELAGYHFCFDAVGRLSTNYRGRKQAEFVDVKKLHRES